MSGSTTTTVTPEPDGGTRTTTRTVDGDGVHDHVVRQDSSGQVIQTGDRTSSVDGEGVRRIESTTTATDPQTGETDTVVRSEQQYLRDSADGSHKAGSSESTSREVDRSGGDVTTTNSAEATDENGNRSVTESTTDASTGLTTLVTTTVDKDGNGTRHTTMLDPQGNLILDADGNPVLDETGDVSEPDDDGSDALFTDNTEATESGAEGESSSEPGTDTEGETTATEGQTTTPEGETTSTEGETTGTSTDRSVTTGGDEEVHLGHDRFFGAPVKLTAEGEHS